MSGKAKAAVNSTAKWVQIVVLAAAVAGAVLEWAGQSSVVPFPSWVLLLLGVIVQTGRILGGTTTAKGIGVFAVLAGLAGGFNVATPTGPGAIELKEDQATAAAFTPPEKPDNSIVEVLNVQATDVLVGDVVFTVDGDVVGAGLHP